MSLGHVEWPETGEMVVATVTRLESYGAYVALDEYDNKEALLHISEISSRWVRNIRNFVRENQKVVLQVLRVDPSKGQVDLSLRRVNKDDRRKKIEQWKKTRKAETLLKLAATELKMTPNDLFDEISPKLNEANVSLYDTLEQTAKKGI
jgi:translation initiation factor 2 subunit 1